MKKIKENFHLIIIVLVTLFILPVTYYFLYTLPNYNAAKLELEKQKYERGQEAIEEKILKEEEKKLQQEEEKRKEDVKREVNKSLLQNCLQVVDSEYKKTYTEACYSWKKTYSSLPSYSPTGKQRETRVVKADTFEICLYSSPFQSSNNALTINNIFNQKKEECYRKYPIN